MAERANLIAQEEQSFTNTVNAYVGVIQAQQLLALNVNNEQVLAKPVAGHQRPVPGRRDHPHRRGAGRGGAGRRHRATRETAEGNLQTARGTFSRWSAFRPPADLVEPQPLRLPVKTEQEIGGAGRGQQPDVVAALFNNAAAKDAIDVAFAPAACRRSACRARRSSRTTPGRAPPRPTATW